MSASAGTTHKKEVMLKEWHKGLRILQAGNFAASTYFGKLGKRFGIPVVITTTVVSSAIFGTLGESEHERIQIAAGFVSILATVLSSLQTFLGYSERSSGHKEAAVGYGELRTEVEVLLSSDLPGVSNLDERIESIRSRWSALDRNSPTLPKRIYAEAANTVGHDAVVPKNGSGRTD